jgi:hypothetical protein
MPILIPTGFEKDGKTVLWTCSDCQAPFSPDRITPNPSISDLKKINANFRVHCERDHKGQNITGLDIAKPNEDPSQAAARIVREATK